MELRFLLYFVMANWNSTSFFIVRHYFMGNCDINVKKFTLTHKIMPNNKKICRIHHNFLCFFGLKLRNYAAAEVKIGGGADKLIRWRQPKLKKNWRRRDFSAAHTPDIFGSVFLHYPVLLTTTPPPYMFITSFLA